jgi:hypothetical protein
MLIRAMGKESEALGGSWSHPFTDVDSWADKYVGYGYEKGLTKGVSATQFGTGNADSDMYLTFMLRALGYDDSKVTAARFKTRARFSEIRTRQYTWRNGGCYRRHLQ